MKTPNSSASFIKQVQVLQYAALLAMSSILLILAVKLTMKSYQRSQYYA